MSLIKHLINDPKYNNLTFVIKPIKQNNSHILSTDIDHGVYKKLINILDENNDDEGSCIKTTYTNRVYRYRDLVMTIDGDKTRRDYYQEKQCCVETVDNFLINIIKKIPIEKQEFPMINNYDAEYTEHLIVYRKTPLVVLLSHDSKNNKYGVKITFELRPLREKYIDSKLDQIMKLINLNL